MYTYPGLNFKRWGSFPISFPSCSFSLLPPSILPAFLSLVEKCRNSNSVSTLLHNRCKDQWNTSRSCCSLTMFDFCCVTDPHILVIWVYLNKFIKKIGRMDLLLGRRCIVWNSQGLTGPGRRRWQSVVFASDLLESPELRRGHTPLWVQQNGLGRGPWKTGNILSGADTLSTHEIVIQDITPRNKVTRCICLAPSSTSVKKRHCWSFLGEIGNWAP